MASSTEKKKVVTHCIQIKDTTYKDYKSLAEKQGMNTSQLIRRVLSDNLNEPLDKHSIGYLLINTINLVNQGKESIDDGLAEELLDNINSLIILLK